MDTYTYRQAADQTWTRITNLTEYGQYTVYEQFDIKGFWHQANALLTCLDYLLNTNQQDNLLTNPNLQDKSIVKNAIQWVFIKHLFNADYTEKLWPADPSNPNWPLYPWDHTIDFSQLWPIWTEGGLSGKSPWLDDYGWWGLALQKAYENAGALGYDQPFSTLLLTMADACWEALRGSWDKINGGAYNSQGSDKYGQPVPLTGKNCVTNETLWLLSQCLHTSDPDQPKYVDQNKLSQNWFLDAYDNGNLLTEGKEGLVLERPGNIKNGMPGDWTWVGDQGLFILACTGSKGAGGDDLYDLATTVNNAVQSQLVDSDHVIHDHNVPIFFEQYTLDYATGKGIYLRCMSPQQEFLPDATAVWKTCKPFPVPPRVELERS